MDKSEMQKEPGIPILLKVIYKPGSFYTVDIFSESFSFILAVHCQFLAFIYINAIETASLKEYSVVIG